MTSNSPAVLAPHTPARIGQATVVEQARVVAEVQAQVIVAQQMPRDINRAVAAMQRSCAMKSLADHAFYSFKRGSQSVSGPTVQLARELARCFGNMNHGVAELLRDDVHGQSEMMAFAWDLETNTRSSTTFIVPHRRDRSEARGGSVALTDMRDIYENNANNGARRLREMIFSILPGWFTEDAIAACYETLAADESDGKTHAERTENAITRFKAIGITAGQLEQRTGAPSPRWSPYDLAQLGVLYRSIMRGELRKEDEFPAAERVTAAEITGHAITEEPRLQPREPEDPIGASGAAASAHTEAPAPAAHGPASSNPTATGRRATSSARAKPALPSKADLEWLQKLLHQIPLGDEADVAVFIAWITCHPADQALTAADVRALTNALAGALDTAGGDGEKAADSLWAKHKQATTS